VPGQDHDFEMRVLDPQAQTPELPLTSIYQIKRHGEKQRKEIYYVA
jgi:hypothetical protein